MLRNPAQPGLFHARTVWRAGRYGPITEPEPIRKILTHLGAPWSRRSALRPEGRPPTGANSSRRMTTDMSFRRRPPSCPVSRSTASEWCRPKAARGPGTANWHAVCPDSRKHHRRGVRDILANSRRRPTRPIWPPNGTPSAKPLRKFH
jgi:hypothetical protein